MSHRYTGTIGRRLEGNLPRAHEVQGTARLLVQQCIDHINHNGGWGQMSRQIALRDGTIVKAIVLQHQRGWEPIVRVEVFAPQFPSSSSPTTSEGQEGGFLLYAYGHQEHIFIPTSIYGTGHLWRLETLYNTQDIAPRLLDQSSAPITWRGLRAGSEGEDEVVYLAWDHGMPARYRLAKSAAMECSGRPISDSDGSVYKLNNGVRGIYVNGVFVATEHGVVGAGVYNNTLLYIAHVDTEFEPNPYKTDRENFVDRAEADSHCATLFALTETWTEITKIRSPNYYSWPWFFSPDGSKFSTITLGDEAYVHVEGRITDLDAVSVYLTDIEKNFHSATTTEATSTDYYPDTAKSKAGDWSTFHPYAWWNYWGKGQARGGSLGGVGSAAIAFASHYCSLDPLDDTILYEDIARLQALLSLHAVEVDAAYAAGETTWYHSPGLNSFGNHHSYGSIYQVDTVQSFWGYFPAPFQVVAQRMVSAWREVGSNTQHYENNYRYNFPVAVDYGFNGEELFIQIKLFSGGEVHTDTESSKRESRYTYKYRETFDATPGSPTVGLSSIATITERKTWECCYDIRWHLLINDEPLVEARGYIDYKRWYERVDTLYRAWQGDSPPNTSIYTPYCEDSQVITERVWLLDVDARERVAIYIKSSVTGETDSRDFMSLGPNDGLVMGMIVKRTGVRKQKRSDTLCIAHKSKVVGSTPLPPVTDPALFPLHLEGASLHLLPRMFGDLDGVENWFPNMIVWMDGVGGALTQDRRWDGTRQCFPTLRRSGSLVVRAPGQIAASFSDATLTPDYRIPEMPQCFFYARPTTYVHSICLGGEWFDLSTFVSEWADGERLMSPIGIL